MLAAALDPGLVLLSAGTYGNVMRVLAPLTPTTLVDEGLAVFGAALEPLPDGHRPSRDRRALLALDRLHGWVRSVAHPVALTPTLPRSAKDFLLVVASSPNNRPVVQRPASPRPSAT